MFLFAVTVFPPVLTWLKKLELLESSWPETPGARSSTDPFYFSSINKGVLLTIRMSTKSVTKLIQSLGSNVCQWCCLFTMARHQSGHGHYTPLF